MVPLHDPKSQNECDKRYLITLYDLLFLIIGRKESDHDIFLRWYETLSIFLLTLEWVRVNKIREAIIIYEK
jgi:hypothetical protein